MFIAKAVLSTSVVMTSLVPNGWNAERGRMSLSTNRPPSFLDSQDERRRVMIGNRRKDED